MNKPRITLSLTHDEALILFELLARFSESGQLSADDAAEVQAIHNLHCALEKTLPAPFSRNYDSLLSDAKANLRTD
jgi:hypothetical protein